MQDLTATNHQPSWVLLSASADHHETRASPLLDDPELVKARQRNQTNPEGLSQRMPWRPTLPFPSRIGLLLTGELRCLSRSSPLLAALARQADLYIVTSSSSAQQARQLTAPERSLIIDEHPRALARDQRLPVASMKQWHKLALGLQLVERNESRRGLRYSHLIKLRSDYHFVHPKRLLQQVIAACHHPQAGLVGASDKVFAGSRDLMMLFKGFFDGIQGWFDQRESDYWPINLQQVLASDEALKWYGMNWPVELIGQPATTEDWRQQLMDGGDELAAALAHFTPAETTTYHRLFTGHPRFASEVCFARFLNFTGIPFRDCRSLRGFLYSDRHQTP